jgi:hypothetical protein
MPWHAPCRSAFWNGGLAQQHRLARSGDQTLKDIRRATRRQFSAEEKIRHLLAHTV